MYATSTSIPHHVRAGNFAQLNHWEWETFRRNFVMADSILLRGRVESSGYD